MIFFEVTALIDVPCRRNVNRFTAMRKNKLAVYLWCSVAPISRRKSILIHSWVYWRITDKSSSNQKHTRSLNIGISVREKTPLCASSAVLKYDSLIAYLFVCHSSIQRDIRDFAVHSFWFRDQDYPRPVSDKYYLCLFCITWLPIHSHNNQVYTIKRSHILFMSMNPDDKSSQQLVKTKLRGNYSVVH